MLDQIFYSLDEKSNTVQKEVIHVEAGVNVKSELSALEAQIVDLKQGNAKNPSVDVDSAIMNYEDQVLVLKGFLGL